MKIMSVDAGNSMGICIVECDEKKFDIIRLTSCDFGKYKDMGCRLLEVNSVLCEYFETHSPAIFATEKPIIYAGRNKSAVSLIQMYGAIVYTWASYLRSIEMEVGSPYFIDPNDVKKVMCGKGNVKKDKVFDAVYDKFGNNPIVSRELFAESKGVDSVRYKQLYDVSDALAIAYTAYNNILLQEER